MNNAEWIVNTILLIVSILTPGKKHQLWKGTVPKQIEVMILVFERHQLTLLDETNLGSIAPFV